MVERLCDAKADLARFGEAALEAAYKHQRQSRRWSQRMKKSSTSTSNKRQMMSIVEQSRRRETLAVLLNRIEILPAAKSDWQTTGITIAQRRDPTAEEQLRLHQLHEEVFGDPLPPESGADKAKAIFQLWNSQPKSLLKMLDEHGANMPEFTPQNQQRFLPRIAPGGFRQGHDWEKSEREMEALLAKARGQAAALDQTGSRRARRRRRRRNR